MVATMCTSYAVMRKAGVNANTSLTGSAAWMESFINQAEGFINSATKVDYLGSWSSLSSGAKYILEDTASSLAAIPVINYDMSGYTTIPTAVAMQNVLWAVASRNISLLKEKDYSDFTV